MVRAIIGAVPAYRNKICIVTGAASGIGLGLTRELAAAGAVVIATDIQAAINEENAAELRRSGARVTAATLDVTDGEAVAALVRETAAEHGRVDVMVNNAGVGLAGEVRDLTLEDWTRVLDVNLMGVVHGVRAVYPLMVEQGFGQIINMSSGAGLCARPGMAPYAAAKSAVVGLSTSLRVEAKDLGVRVSTVCPAYIASGIYGSTVFRNVDGAALTARNPLTPMSAERCARIILRGAARNRGIIPVGKLAWLEWWLVRLSPRLHERLVRVRGDAIRAHRLEG